MGLLCLNSQFRLHFYLWKVEKSLNWFFIPSIKFVLWMAHWHVYTKCLLKQNSIDIITSWSNILSFFNLTCFVTTICIFCYETNLAPFTVAWRFFESVRKVWYAVCHRDCMKLFIKRNLKQIKYRMYQILCSSIILWRS